MLYLYITSMDLFLKIQAQIIYIINPTHFIIYIYLWSNITNSFSPKILYVYVEGQAEYWQ